MNEYSIYYKVYFIHQYTLAMTYTQRCIYTILTSSNDRNFGFCHFVHNVFCIPEKLEICRLRWGELDFR